jgi:23S rRNA pseudouridine2604 synthase
MPVSPARPPAAARDADEGERLAKRLAHLLPCSRSEAERYVEAGFVSVDGVVVDTPQFRVRAGQRVELAADATLAPPMLVTLLLHKPAGVGAVGDAPDALRLLVPHNRASGDLSGIRTLARHLRRPPCLSPLDADETGLVVFSQDPRVARKLLEDAATLEHEFLVEVAGAVDPALLPRLARAAAGRLPAQVSIGSRSESGASTGLRFALKGYEPGRIARICAASGLRVLAARRLRIGRVPLAGMPVGQWRYLGPGERF